MRLLLPLLWQLLALACSLHGELDESEVERWEQQEAESLRTELLQRRVAVSAGGAAKPLGEADAATGLLGHFVNGSGGAQTGLVGAEGGAELLLQESEDSEGEGRSEKYNVHLARACAELAQAASCGPDPRLHTLKCNACQKAGFQISPGTSRLIRQQQLFEKDSTFVHVERLKWLRHAPRASRRWKPRAGEDLQHAGEDCYSPCGSVSGYCAWCGVGHACCRRNEVTGPAECNGATGFLSGDAKHQCVTPVPAEKRPTSPVANAGSNCWTVCGQAGGFCSFCGAGNACCRKDFAEDPIECHNAAGFLSPDRHQCVVPGSSVPSAGPLDFGCSVAIRGTRTTANKINLALFWNEHVTFAGCPGCRVFIGFWSIWRQVEDKVVAALEDNGCVPGSQQSVILVTGHSMGGAVGILAMMSLQARGYNVVQSYNFESPRVGNEAFSNAFREWFGRHPSIFRVTWKKDPVPHVPPSPMYRHVGYEAYFPSDDPKNYIICESEEDDKCADRYNVMETLSHSGYNEHCLTALAPGGNICACPF